MMEGGMDILQGSGSREVTRPCHVLLSNGKSGDVTTSFIYLLFLLSFWIIAITFV